MKFSDFPINPLLLQGLTEAGYIDCTPVQEEALKASLELGRDVYAQSQTGTGKTAAFLVPAIDILSRNEDPHAFALILAPTRELALQVDAEARLLAAPLRWPMACLYGGMPYDKQAMQLRKRPKVVTGTVGRVMDFCKQGALDMSNARVVIIDEADRLFDMGFHKDVLALMGMAPKPTERRSFLFSATLSPKVGNLAWGHMNNPADIVIEANHVTLDAIDQSVYHVSREEKGIFLIALLRQINPYNAVIFCNTKSGAARLTDRINRAGYKCALLVGDVPQRKRTRIIEDLKLGKIHFMAATDVAARGIHIPDLSLVVNFDLPDDPESYIHRIGRTARAGKSGRAVSLACERYIYNLAEIEKLLKKRIAVAEIDPELKGFMDEARRDAIAHAKTVREHELAHPESVRRPEARFSGSGPRGPGSGRSEPGKYRSGPRQEGNASRGNSRPAAGKPRRSLDNSENKPRAWESGGARSSGKPRTSGSGSAPKRASTSAGREGAPRDKPLDAQKFDNDRGNSASQSDSKDKSKGGLFGRLRSALKKD